MNSAFFVAAFVAHNIEIAAKNDILAKKRSLPICWRAPHRLTELALGLDEFTRTVDLMHRTFGLPI